MSIWNDIALLLEGIEQDSASSAGNAPKHPKMIPCPHGVPNPKTCAYCNGSYLNKNQRKKNKILSDDDKETIKHFLDEHRDGRCKPDISFNDWNKAIEKDFLGYIRDHYQKEKSNKIIRAWRNTEKDAARGENNVQERRMDSYEHGTTYDDYVYDVFHHVVASLPNAFKQRIFNKIKLMSALGDNEQEELLSKGGTENNLDQAEIEMQTPEFAEFKKWAEQMWATYGKDIEFDQKTWDETLYYFASSGHNFGYTPKVNTYPGGGKPKPGTGIKVSTRDSQKLPEPNWEEELKKRQESGKLGTLTPESISSLWQLITEAMKTFGDDDEPGKAIPPIRDPAQRDRLGPTVDYTSGQPLYKELMARDVGVAATIFKNAYIKNLKSNKSLAQQNQAQIDKGEQYLEPPPNLNPQELDQWKKNQMLRGNLALTGQPQKQIDPQLFKKKHYKNSDNEREKRKFLTWWDLGFTGNIPFTNT